jgi:hypothetical protein
VPSGCLVTKEAIAYAKTSAQIAATTAKKAITISFAAKKTENKV